MNGLGCHLGWSQPAAFPTLVSRWSASVRLEARGGEARTATPLKLLLVKGVAVLELELEEGFEAGVDAGALISSMML